MQSVDFQRTPVFPALQLKSAVKIAPIAAKVANDAYNICSGHRRARVRDKAAGQCDSPQSLIRLMIAGDGNGKVDSYGSDL
jgi:hypothetical protein